MNRGAALDAVFKPVRPPTTFEETVERLGTAIRVGLLVPGSKLPPERQLADELRISRSTLRQALTTLVQSGHLTSVRGRAGGTFVAERPPLSEADAEPLGRDAWATLDHRVAIEVGSVILAAERAQPPDLDALDVLVARMGGRRRVRALPARRHPLSHRGCRGVALAAPGHRDDRGPGRDERPHHPHRPPGGGAHPVQRPARGDSSPTCASATPRRRSR